MKRGSVKFKCNHCGEETEKTKRCYDKIQACRSCVSSVASLASKRNRTKPRSQVEFLGERTIQYEERKEIFEKEGFVLLSLENEYGNVFTPLSVLCPEGHSVQITWNNFASDRVKKKQPCCSECSAGKRRKPFREVKEVFERKGHHLLMAEEDYEGNKQDLAYRCGGCGKEATVRLHNADKDGWDGCSDCSKARERLSFDVVRATIEETGCILVSEEEDYKGINSELVVICECDESTEFLVSLKRFRSGKRCRECLYARREEARIENGGKDVKWFTFPSGRREPCLGFELFCLRDLLNEGTNEDDIVCGPRYMPKIKFWHGGKVQRYYPDVYVKSQNKLIEVKSTYTLEVEQDLVMLRLRKAKQSGYRTELRVYDKSGRILEKEHF